LRVLTTNYIGSPKILDKIYPGPSGNICFDNNRNDDPIGHVSKVEDEFVECLFYIETIAYDPHKKN
jgi:hypothetical protein